VLRLTAVPRPRICLLPTAGGDSEHQIRRFYETYRDRLCEPSHIALFRLGREPVPLREHLLTKAAIYVGGGSIVNLLAIWRAQGLDGILREAGSEGVVLAGLSAGSMCWFEWGITTSSACIFRETHLEETVTARKSAQAYAVTQSDVTPLAARRLDGGERETATLPAVAELRRLRLARLGAVRD
jgi:hypothetical protein